MNILGLISQLIGIKTLRLTEMTYNDPLFKVLTMLLLLYYVDYTFFLCHLH